VTIQGDRERACPDPFPLYDAFQERAVRRSQALNAGGHQHSASGGQRDFVRGAYASKGGESIIAAHTAMTIRGC